MTTSWENGQKQNKSPRIREKQRKVVKTIQGNLVLQSIQEVFKVFCRETTLHGMKHIIGSQYYNRWHKRLAVRISRVLWFLSCVAGIYCAVLMMRLVWQRFQNNPTITTIDTTNHPIWNVPFPSVTICNINKVYAPRAENITRLLKSRGIAEDRILKFYEMIPNLIYPEYVDEEFLNISNILREKGYTPDSLMSELAQPCDRLLKLCYWKGTEMPCNELFKLSRSTEGICCSFNYKALRLALEPDTEFDYSSQKIYYVSGAGRNMGLNVLLDVEMEHSLAMSKPIYGAEVLIHDAEEFPQASLTSAVAQPGKEVYMSIVPSVINSKISIRSTPVSARQCYFSDEQKLRATRKYSLNSCLAECRVDFIVSKCSCLPFFYPEIPAIEAKYRPCELSDVACLRRYRTFWSSLQPPSGTPGFNTTEEVGMNCNCAPSCSETTYALNTIDANRIPYHRSPIYPMDLTNLTTLLVHFKELNCIRYRRDVYMTWDGLFASFGGIFGLCLGGSIMSLVEMAYFFTIRLTLTIYRRCFNKTGDKTPVAPPIRETEQNRQQIRFQQSIAESRRIYSLTPILNPHFKNHKAKKNVKVVW